MVGRYSHEPVPVIEHSLKKGSGLSHCLLILISSLAVDCNGQNLAALT